MNYIVDVILLKSTRAFDIEYSYLADDSIASHGCGVEVVVPFGKGNKLVSAIIINIYKINEYKGKVPVSKLKHVNKIAENSETLDKEAVDIANMMRDKYVCSQSDAIKLLLPPGGNNIKEKTIKTVNLALSPEETQQNIDNGSLNRIQHIRVLEYLIEQGETDVDKVLRDFSMTKSVLNTLSKKGYVSFSDRVKEEEAFSKGKDVIYPRPESLTDEQTKVLSVLMESQEGGEFAEFLLHGITGSGKTEVYLNLIENVIKNNGDAIVLVPEIALTPQMTARFIGRFGERVAVLHSRLTGRERFDQWQLIKKGKVNVVVGARSAVFAPFENLQLIIIDEEQEQTYKSETTPKYHAAEIARYRCKYNDCMLLLGSATPSVETFCRASKGEIGYLSLKERATGGQLPEVALIDMRQELESGNRGVFSRQLEEEIEKNINNKQQTILLINRRGYSSILLCKECGYSPRCHDCNVGMTYHSSNERVICHYCGVTQKVKKVCPKCGSEHISPIGVGTQKVETEVKRLFPQASVIRMDMDTTTGRNSHEDILKSFVNDKIDILVGTQMIAKGHDLPSVTLVGIIAADSILNMDDFRASEKTFQLITQAAGRAGRGSIQGRVVVQSYNIDDYSIRAAAKQNYKGFYDTEIMIREQLHYPPFVHIATAVLSGTKDKKVFDATVELKNIIQKIMNNSSRKNKTDSIELLGPARCPITKTNGKYRWRIIIKSTDEIQLAWLCGLASDKCEDIRAKMGKDQSPITVSIDINPVNML